MIPTGTVRESNIASLFANVFNKKNVNYDGTVGIFTLQKQFVFQINYENKLRVSESVSQTQEGLEPVISPLIKMNSTTTTGITKPAAKAVSFPINANTNVLTVFGDDGTRKVNSQVCTNWYLVTTYANGSQDWVFLFQTCTDNCEQTSITPKGEIHTIKIACRGSGGGGGGGCSLSLSDGQNILATTEGEILTTPSTMNFDQPEYDPSTGRYEKFGETPPANFLTIKQSPYGVLLASATYGAIYASKVYKNNNDTAEHWKWASVSFTNQVNVTSGQLITCTGITLTTTDGGTIITGDERGASSKLNFSYYPIVTCVGNVQIGPTVSDYAIFNWGSPAPAK